MALVCDVYCDCVSFPFGILCDVYFDFVTFPFVILGQVWYLIVSIPDPCCLSYFDLTFVLKRIINIHNFV